MCKWRLKDEKEKRRSGGAKGGSGGCNETCSSRTETVSRAAMRTECAGIKGEDNGTERGKEMKSSNRGGVREREEEDAVNGQRVGCAERKSCLPERGRQRTRKRLQ